MSGKSNKSSRSGIGEIQWNLLDDGAGKIGKASGMKIEYSTSDEIDFAQKLSIIMRKKLMQQIFDHESDLYQQELNSIGLFQAHYTVCEESRKCAEEQAKKKKNYINHAQESKMSKLFKMYKD